MPVNVVKTKADEAKWDKAKRLAEKGKYKGKSKWKVTMSIFQNMKKHSGYRIASPEEVNFFVKAAMAQYKKLGIPFEQAEKLFAAKMAKLAVDLGLAKPEDKAAKIASAASGLIAKIKGIPKKQAATIFAHYLLKHSNDVKGSAIDKVVEGTLNSVDALDQGNDNDIDNSSIRSKIEKSINSGVKKLYKFTTPNIAKVKALIKAMVNDSAKLIN